MTGETRYRWFAESRWILLLVGAVVFSVAGNGWLADGLWLSLAPESGEMGIAAKAMLVLGVISSLLPMGVLALIRIRERDRRRGWRGLWLALGRELAGPLRHSGRRLAEGATEAEDASAASGVVREGAAWMSVLAATGLGVGAGWMADGLFGASAAQGVIGLLMAVVFAWVAYRAVPRALPIHARLQRASKPDARALIVPLSRYRLDEQESDRGEVNLLELIESSDLESLARRVDADEALWRWNLRPLLVALRAHLPLVRYVVLIPAKLSAGRAFENHERLCSWLRRELEKHHVMVKVMESVDSGSFTSVYESMATAIENAHEMAARKGEPLLDSEIVIDVTGGKKPASIGAAAASLDREVMFEYVDTEAIGEVGAREEDCIRSFDIEYRTD